MNKVTKQKRPDYSDILDAHNRISRQIKETSVVRHDFVDQLLNCKASFKCENLQDTGAFKLRGASNAVLRLREQGIFKGVATHSSGNHGAAIARAASLDGREAWIVMPENSVPEKIEAVKRHGGQIVFCESNQKAREDGLAKLVQKGLIPIHPYDHPDIIAGQGTAARELLLEVSDLDVLMTPVGGGGLISGSAIVARHMIPEITIIGAEPVGAADAAASFHQGKRVSDWDPETIADGLRALIGEMTFPIILDLVDNILTVTESGIKAGMALIYEHLNMIIEPSSATVIAAMLEHPGIFASKKVGVILSGGNIDKAMFPEMADSNHD